jgi:hypothetical protein
MLPKKDMPFFTQPLISLKVIILAIIGEFKYQIKHKSLPGVQMRIV